MAVPWVSQLPSWQVDAVQFAAKMLRGSNAVDMKLDEALALDPLIPAETLFQSQQWQTALLFDFNEILDQRKTAMEPPAPVPKQEEPEPAKPDPAPPVEPPVDTPHEPEAMPHVMAEVPEEEVPSGPAALDRLKFFSLLDIPSDIASTLQGGDDHYFEQVLDWARVKVNTFVEMEIKSPTAQGKRNQVEALYKRNGGTSFFIVYDVKCRLHIKDDLLVNPWRRPTPLNSAEFKQWLAAFWLDPKVPASGPPLFRSNDVFVAMDGRSPTNSEAMQKQLTSVLKGVENMPKRLLTVLRRAYTNSEFAVGGYAAPKRKCSLNPQAPDPLENAFIVVSKEFVLKHRDSSMPTVVADNFSRGWQGMDMKSRTDHGFATVTPAVYHSLLKKTDGDETGDTTKTEEGRPLMGSDEPPAAADGAAEDEEDAKSKQTFPIAPWENSEQHSQLLVDLYKYEPAKALIKTDPRIVSIEPSVSLATACCRKHMLITMFTESERHKQAVFQSLMMRITYEIMTGRADGFVMRRRLLTRENSLSGSESQRPPLPSPSAASVEQSQDAQDSAADGVAEDVEAMLDLIDEKDDEEF
ncbi:unnamed protein product [Symbiodinium necroappetens]|uniref:Uncharacterized protein n=1 Tax=Symbiodinium necroappetens TaxID=1628268 RepID=A0A812T495_9DINO|nr:unnamed protein product [Symbiodinium necroappetens]